jgi:hypothetical protein
LRRYRWSPVNTLGTGGREPLHDLASHPSDAFRYLAVGVKMPKAELDNKPKRKPIPVSAWS